MTSQSMAKICNVSYNKAIEEEMNEKLSLSCTMSLGHALDLLWTIAHNVIGLFLIHPNTQLLFSFGEAASRSTVGDLRYHVRLRNMINRYSLL